MTDVPRIDISPDEWEIAQAILQEHVPDVEVWAIGPPPPSPVMDAADLALALITEEAVAATVLGALRKAFSESPFPRRVDFVDWSTMTDDLREEIRSNHALVQGGGRVRRRRTRTGGRPASTGVISGDYALSVGEPATAPPAGWKWTRLTDVARLETGHTPSRRRPEYWGGDTPWIGIRDATGNHGRVIQTTEQYTNSLGIENSSARVLPTGTICLSRTASVGYVVVMGRPMATSQDFVNWVCSDSIEPHFLKYVLLSEREAFPRFATGSTHQTIYFPELKAFHVQLPPLDEQRGIVGVLKALDDRIELNRRMTATLEGMARALFRSWFVDFDPVRAKAEGRDPGLPDDFATLFSSRLVDTELGQIPEGWEAGRISDLASLSRHGVSPGDNPDEEFAHYSIPAYDDDLIPRAERGASIKSGKHVVPPNSVLISKLNPRIPRVWMPVLQTRRRSICSTEFLVAMPTERATTAFLYCLFRDDDFRSSFSSLVTGTSGSHQRVKPQSFLAMRAVVAPRPVVEAFSRLASTWLGKSNGQRLSAGTLALMRDTLLPKLVSGEVRVPATATRKPT